MGSIKSIVCDVTSIKTGKWYQCNVTSIDSQSLRSLTPPIWINYILKRVRRALKKSFKSGEREILEVQGMEYSKPEPM